MYETKKRRARSRLGQQLEREQRERDASGETMSGVFADTSGGAGVVSGNGDGASGGAENSGEGGI